MVAKSSQYKIVTVTTKTVTITPPNKIGPVITLKTPKDRQTEYVTEPPKEYLEEVQKAEGNEDG